MHDELDILKEVGNIAAAHGSLALSEIFKKKILLEVPQTSVVTEKTISDKVPYNKTGVAVFSKIMTGLNGKVIFLLDERNAFKLNDLSYKIKFDERGAGVLTEMGMSVIKEIGNMVTSAYITAIGMMFKRVILLSPPTLISGTVEEILNITLFSGEERGEVLLVEAVFEEPEDAIKGSFYLVLTPEAAGDILKVCKKMLKDVAG